MWGPTIVGFGSLHYKYASGREGDMPLIGFSPRKQNLTLYIGGGFEQLQGTTGPAGEVQDQQGAAFTSSGWMTCTCRP